MNIAVKGKKRVEILNEIEDILMYQKIYEELYKHGTKESKVKRDIFKELQSGLSNYFKNYLYSNNKNKDRLDKIARESIAFEGNPKTTVNNITFLGVQHRPDLVVGNKYKDKEYLGFKAGIEIKKGDTGIAVREGLGQSLVYANEYDFVIYLFIATNQEIWSGCIEQKEFVKSLWKNYNIRFHVIGTHNESTKPHIFYD